ncbi:AarF/ABC1/UbiB kinase family protein [Ruegeria sp. HKCCD6228]|uniref:ABC1 kinase family protein n=1 Tax=Ruegeria sp. HKCCD6228 TaxID=2683001 RepID=UPI001492EC52|nr:AarF/ABC1/UbiB kinase family protein [Ruegeria sp. HKCCD6228]NOD99610.1 AarF/ABC1/UbiB kinase family protein [Ruegeria sp. HKCCD6228]
MTDPKSSPTSLAVPTSRLVRVAGLSSMTAGIAGNVAVRALREIGRGARPDMRGLLMSSGNVTRIADQLSRMRGAAMKVGQLISMDAGEVLPPELADIMASLRDQAHFMPPKQLREVLNRTWGTDWRKSFKTFNVRPIAAASIGQVHRATLKDGRDVAIKVQYPGIARSIDSDIANVAALVRMSGLLPKSFDLGPYIQEARSQLREETDYEREGRHMRHFADLLQGDEAFEIPEFFPDWSTPEVLTMSFLEGRPIETVSDATREERNRVSEALVDLTLREVFEFGIMQSDPNFANYRYNPANEKISLLDFGAARALQPSAIDGYMHLLRAGLREDDEQLRNAAIQLKLVEGDGPFDDRILGMIRIVFDAILSANEFDFSDRTLSNHLNKEVMALARAGYVPTPMPMDILYLQRKIGGIFLLVTRLSASLPVKALLAKYVI